MCNFRSLEVGHFLPSKVHFYEQVHRRSCGLNDANGPGELHIHWAAYGE